MKINLWDKKIIEFDGMHDLSHEFGCSLEFSWVFFLKYIFFFTNFIL